MKRLPDSAPVGTRSLAPGYVLRPPTSPDDWTAYHEIRRRAIFDVYHRDVAYKIDHPDEDKRGNFPMVLVTDGMIVGTVRVDLVDADRAALRLVAIAPEEQGRGHGAVLLKLAEDFARRRGRRRIVLHGNPPTIGFYLQHGYVEAPWEDDPALGDSIVSNSIGVAKDL